MLNMISLYGLLMLRNLSNRDVAFQFKELHACKEVLSIKTPIDGSCGLCGLSENNDYEACG